MKTSIKSLVLGALLIAGSLLSSCGGGGSSGITSSATSSSYSVRYEVTGTPPTLNLIQWGVHNGLDKVESASLPWETTVTLNTGDRPILDVLYVDYSSGAQSHQVTIKIFVDGNLYAEDSGSGTYMNVDLYPDYL